MAIRIDARDIEIGDVIEGQRVTGSFFDARGAAMIEYGNRWHRYVGMVDVERQEAVG